MNKMLITLNKKESRLIVAIKGELDASTCIPAEKQFKKALATDAAIIYVDCSQLTFISSAGIGVLISLHHACAQKGILLFFCDMQLQGKKRTGDPGSRSAFCYGIIP